MQLIESRRIPRRRKWLQRGLLLGVALLGVGAWIGYEPALGVYRRWKQQRALHQAQQFIAQKDAPNAKLALDVALAAAPGNLEAIRVAAGMLEQVGAAQAIRLRRAVTRAAPESPEDAAALVMCCLRFNDVNAAKDALTAFKPSFDNNPAALRATLAFAIYTDDAPVIDFIYGKLRTLYPQDEELKVSHALLLLKHPQEAKRAAARHELEGLAANPKLTLRIHRELAGYALATKNYAEARAEFERALADAHAEFSDRLQLANIDVLIDHKPFGPVFEQLTKAAQQEGDVVQLARWAVVQNHAAEVDAWLATLPAKVRDLRELRMLAPEIAAQSRDWDRFSAALRSGAWGPISAETTRLVDAVHAVQSRNRAELSRETWDLAIDSAGGNLGTYTVLYRVASTWDWQSEMDRVLWTVVRSFPDQAWAHQALFDRLAARRDTAAMRDLMALLQQSDASVDRYSHDWALLTLLLSPTTQPSPAKDTMKRLHDGSPKNANYTLGYAFALAQSRRPAEAVALVQSLTSEERDYAPRQPYLAYIYGVARDAAAVSRAEKLGENMSYLPEEARLFAQAREELARKEPAPPAKKDAPKPAKA